MNVIKPTQIEPVQLGGVEGGYRSTADHRWYQARYRTRGVMFENPLEKMTIDDDSLLYWII